MRHTNILTKGMEEQVILDIKIDSAEAQANILAAKKALADLKTEQEKLDESYKQGQISQEAYTKATAANTEATIANKDAVKANTDVIRQNVREQKNAEGSLTQMRAQLKQMVSAYDNMSKAERESEQSGGALLKKIQEQTKAIQDAEEASGRHQRNVGNYPKVFDLTSTSIGKLLNGINGLTAAAPANANGLKAIAGGIKTVNLNLLKLLANPIVAIIAAIVLAIMGVMKVIKMVIDEMKSLDAAGTSIQSLLAAFQPILDIFRKALSAVAMALGEVVKGVAAVVTAITSLIPAFRESAQEAQNYVQSMDALEEADRQFTIQKAKNNKEIAELQSKALDKEKYTAEQRAAFLKRAQDLEKASLKQEYANEKERMRLKEQEFLKAHGWETKKGEDRRRALEQLSDDQKDELARMQAHLIDLEAAQDEHTRRLRQKEIAAQEEAKKEEEQRRQKAKAAAEKRAQQRAAAAENELNAIRALEDAELALMDEGQEKQLKAAQLAYQRSVDDLKKQVEEQRKAGTLTVKAEAAIKARLLDMEASYLLQIDEIRLNARKETNRKLYEEAKTAAEKEARLKEVEAKALETAESLAQLKEMQAVGNNERAKLQLQLQYADERVRKARQEYDRLKAIGDDYQAYGYESLEAYQMAVDKANIAVIKSDMQRSQQQKAIADYDKKVQEGKYQAIMGALGNLQGLMDAVGKDNEAAAKASKVLALATIAIETGKAMATAITGAMESASATGPAAVFTAPAFIAEMVGIVLGGVASAIGTVKSATFATGGYVQGAGTATSDSISAKLSNGESVMTAKATSMFYDTLSAMNVAGGGIPFPKSGHKRTFATGGVVSGDAISSARQVQQMQDTMQALVENIQPVVSVKEITNVSNRVKVKERIATT